MDILMGFVIVIAALFPIMFGPGLVTGYRPAIASDCSGYNLLTRLRAGYRPFG